MSLVSVSFLLFLGAVILAYYIVPGRGQWIVLLLSDLFFLYVASPYTLIFLLITACSVYAMALQIERIQGGGGEKEVRRKRTVRILILGAVLNFGILFALKYYNFAAENLSSVVRAFRPGASLPVFDMILPLGISFYTFQAVGYLIDVYRGREKAERNFLRLALFLSFFPQMTQGPISRYSQLSPQLRAVHPLSAENLERGCQRMLWGYFKKMVIADRAGVFVSYVFGNSESCDGLQIFLAMGLYALQIYTDFSGGIDVVIGAAGTMGIVLPENFRQPYFGTSVQDYWRRWHMTLTGWMRDYVFFPLTLSKMSNRIGKWGRKHLGKKIGKQLPAYLPTFVTFLLIGVWHGAGWGFIAYGTFNAVIIVLSMMLTPVFDAMKKGLHINEKSFGWKCFGIIRTFLIMMYAKTLTRAASVPAALSMMKRSFTLFAGSSLTLGKRLGATGLQTNEYVILLIAVLVLFMISVLKERGINIRESISGKPLPLRWAIWLVLIASILVFGVYGEGYSAGNFVYRNY